MVTGLGWLMFGLAGSHPGMLSLPSADGPKVEVLSDAGGRFTLEQVLTAPASRWADWPGRDYIRAAHGDAVWMRVTLRNPGPTLCVGVLADTEYFSDWVDAWMTDQERLGEKSLRPEAWRPVRSGEARASKEKNLWSRTAAFAVTVPAGGERVI